MSTTSRVSSLAILLSAVALAAPEGPPYYDRKRNLENQTKAASEAGAAAKVESDPEKLAALMLDESGLVRDRVFSVLANRTDDALMQKLTQQLGHRDEFVAATVAELFAVKRFAGAREALEKAGLAHQSELVALESIWALEAIADAASAPALEKAYSRRREHRVKGDALIALARIQHAGARETVDEALKKGAPPVRIAALLAMRAIDSKEGAAAAVEVIAAPPLEKKEAVWEPRLLFAAIESLSTWTSRTGEKALVVRAVDALIDRLPRSEGLPLHELGVALNDLTGAEGLEADPQIWRAYWTPRRETFEPKDKVLPADAPPRRRSPRGGGSTEKPPAGGDDGEGAPKAGGRVETGGGARTRVRFHGVPVFSKRLVFAQDTSGNMNKPLEDGVAESPSKMKFSKEELVRVLDALPDDVHTNVMFFASEYWRHAEKLVPLGRGRPQLIDFVNKAETPDYRQAQNRHKTRSNLYDTLAAALEDPEIDTVFFLSEGGPNEGRWIDDARFMRHLLRLNQYQRVQVHTLQVTDSRSGAAFLERVAKDTGGRFYDLDAIKAARADKR